MLITLLILLLSAVFFVNGKVRSDIVALCALVALLLFHILTPDEALSGFSNNVVIMMVGLFVVGGAILLGLQALVGPLGSGMAQALAYAVAGGVPALVVTFGLAAALRLPEASFVTGMLSRLSRRRAA